MKNVVKVMCIALFCLLFGIGSYAASYTDATEVAYDLPLEAVLPDGRMLTPVDYRGDYFCFPGNIDLSEVTFVYTGERKLYLPESDTFVAKGETFATEMSVGEHTFYEYVEDKDTYYSYKATVMQGSSVSALYIDFDDSYTFNVLRYLGESKENSVTGTLYMTDSAGEVLYDGALDNIRCRGNSSFGSPGLQGDKRSFNIKLATKTELIEGAGEMKKWSLLHMRLDVGYDYDLTGLTTLLGLGTYEALCDDGYFTNKIECVDVYIEGEYRGAYLLVERLDVNAAVDITDSDKYVEGESADYEWVRSKSDPAIDKGISWYRCSRGITAAEGLDITGGYILEVTASPDRCGFATSRGIAFDIKAPEKCTKEQVQYIAAYVQSFEDALFSRTGYNSEGKHYSEYIDMKSLADSFLTYAFFQNWELMRTSTYLYKDVEGSERERLTFGPAWDFETGAQTMMNDETLFGTHHFYDEYRQYIWLEQLWKHADFMNVATERAHALSSHMHGMLDGEDGGVYALLDSQIDSMTMNWERWTIGRLDRVTNKFTGVEPTYFAYAEYHIEALRTRLDRWDELWADEYLLGADITEEYDASSGEYILTAVPHGTAEAYTWYRVTDGGDTERLNGEDAAVLKTAEAGTYYCAVSGPNNAYYKRASGTTFSDEALTVRAFCTVSAETEDIQAQEGTASLPSQTDGGTMWWLIGALVLIICVGAVAVFLIIKKKK